MVRGSRASRRDDTTGSLFASPDEDRIRQDLLGAFSAYVKARAGVLRTPGRAGRPWRAESEAVYREMWAAFVAWCAPRLVELETLDGEDIDAYLASRGGAQDLTPRYAWRLIALVDWITRYVALERGIAPNPAAAALLKQPRYRDAWTDAFEPELDYLTARESRTLIAYLTDNGNAARQAAQRKAWTDVRDRTAVALQLGAGLTPGECRTLRLADVVIQGGDVQGLPWKLKVPANGNYPARETPLASWAARQLRHWLSVRDRQGIPGDVLFPASAAGKPWSRPALYESGRKVLEDAGLPSPAGGTYRLRHTFALRQLARGKTDAEVAAWLGLQKRSALEKYRRIVDRPVTDLV